MLNFATRHLFFLSIMVLVFINITPTTAKAAYWAKKFGGTAYDKAEAVSHTSDGGFIVAGWTDSFGDRSANFLLIKLDADGNLEWQRVYEGPQIDLAHDVKQTRDGGYIIVGRTNHDILVIKTDANGNILWQKGFTAGQYKHACAYSVQETSDGGYVVAGKVQSSPGGLSDLLIMKLSQTGAIQWQHISSKKLESSYDHDPTDEAAYAVQQTRDGGFIVAGYTQFFGAGGVWRNHICVLKLDENGNLEWNREFGNYYSYDEAHAVRQTADGGYVIAGTHNDDIPNSDAWVIRLDADGGLLWSRTYGGSGSDHAYAVRETPDGGFIVAGSTDSFGPTADLWLLKLSFSGEIVWQRAYGSELHSDYAYDVESLEDGGYIVAGQYDSTDFWVLKLDQEGRIPSCPLGEDTEAKTFAGGGGIPLQTTKWAQPVSPAETNLTAIEPEIDVNEQCFHEPPNEPPVIDSFTADPTEGVAPLEVTFTCQAHDPDGGTIPSIEWFFGDSQWPYYTFDGNFTITHTYSAAGTYSAYCRVWDDEDQNATSGNITITVSSPVIYHELDVNVAQGGSVSSEPEGIDCGEDCQEQYSEGEKVTLTATPAEGFVFSGWGGACASCGTNPTCTLVMDEDKSCTAGFEEAVTPSWTDITDMLETNRSRTLYDRIHRAFFVLIDVENTSGEDLSGPIRMVIEDPTIPVKTIEGVGLTPDGVTEDGDPYFIIVPEGGSLASGDMLEDLRVNFELQRRRLDFGIRIEQLVQPW